MASCKNVVPGGGSLPDSLLQFQGLWDADTNTPTLASGVGTTGDFYYVSVAGSTNLDGITDWQVGDAALFDGTVWRKLDNTDSVQSVAGKTGVVTLDDNDLQPTHSPTNYTGGVDLVNHLSGIDTELGNLATTISNLDDQDIASTVTPSNYTATATPGVAGQLEGIDAELGTIAANIVWTRSAPNLSPSTSGDNLTQIGTITSNLAAGTSFSLNRTNAASGDAFSLVDGAGSYIFDNAGALRADTFAQLRLRHSDADTYLNVAGSVATLQGNTVTLTGTGVSPTIQLHAPIENTNGALLSFTTDGTPATGGYVFDSNNAFATGQHTLFRANGSNFFDLRPGQFAHTGSGPSSIGGSLTVRANGGAGASLTINDGNLVYGSAFPSVSYGFSQLLYSMGDNNGSKTMNFVDDSQIRIQGILDGGGRRQFARIRTLLDATITNAAVQIWNETAAIEGTKLIQLINNGNTTADNMFSVDATGTVELKGGLQHNQRSVAANINTDNDGVILVDTSAIRTITLSTADAGRSIEIVIKDSTGSANTNNITIATEGAETIDGAATQTISTNYGFLRMVSDGSNWFIIG